MHAVFGNGLVAKTLLDLMPRHPTAPTHMSPWIGSEPRQFHGIDVSDKTRVFASMTNATRQALPVQADDFEKHQVPVRGSARQPLVIINATGYTDVDKAEDEPERANMVNGLGAENLALLALAYGALYVHISSDAVVGGGSYGTWDELARTAGPCNAYGRSKLLGEELVRRSGARALIVRTGSLYGKYGKNRASTLAHPLMGPVRADAKRHVAPTSAEALCRVVLELIRQEQTGLYHVMCTGRTTWYEFARLAAEMWQSAGVPKVPIEKQEGMYGKAYRGLSSLLSSALLPLRGIQIPSWEQALTEHVSSLQRELAEVRERQERPEA